MAERKFEDGTQVRLKSGGPIMTVVNFGEYGSVQKYLCQWFDAKQQLVEDTFIEAALQRMD